LAAFIPLDIQSTGTMDTINKAEILEKRVIINMT